MSVTLNIIGIFCGGQVDISGYTNPTVEQVMNLAVRDPGYPLMNYGPLGGEYVDFIQCYFSQGFNSTRDPSIHYDPGLYKLNQTFTGSNTEPYSVWQYYIIDANGNSATPKGDPSYTVTTVADQYTVTWRLVTICNGPTGSSQRLKSLLSKRAIQPVSL